MVKETPIVGSIISAGSFYNSFFKIGESIKRGDNPKDADILGAMGDIVGVRGVFFGNSRIPSDFCLGILDLA